MAKPEEFTALGKIERVKLAQKIRVAGVKEKNLDFRNELVVAAIRDFVVHIIKGKDLAEDYLLEHTVESIPEGTQIMLGINEWQRIFNQQKCSYYSRPQDLSCELLQVASRDEEMQMTYFESLSSTWGLVGLNQDKMNRDGITYKERVELLQEALVDGKLSIVCFKTQTIGCHNNRGPVIIGKRL